MKKGYWSLTLGVLLGLYQFFGISGDYFAELNIYYVNFSSLLEINTDSAWIYFTLKYFIGALSIIYLITGCRIRLKEAPLKQVFISLVLISASCFLIFIQAFCISWSNNTIYYQFLDIGAVDVNNALLSFVATYGCGIVGLILLAVGIHLYSKHKENRFTRSYHALKDTRIMTQCALLVALYVVFDLLPKFPFFEITFGFVALAGIAYIVGPISAFYCGCICEILGYIMMPTGPFHVGFTFTSMLTGFVMGCFLYEREISISRVITSRTLVAVFLNLGLNTFWLKDLYGQAFLALIPTRSLKLLQLPLDVFLIFTAITIIFKVNKNLPPVKNKQKKKQK